MSHVELANTKGGGLAGVSDYMLSSLKKIFVWTFGILVLLILVIWVVVVIFFPDEEVLRMILGQVRARTDWKVNAKDLDLDLFSKLVLTDIEIGPKDGFDEPAVKIGRVTLGYDLASILHEHVTIESADIQAVSVAVVRHGSRTNIETMLEQFARGQAEQKKEDALEAKAAESGWTLEVNKVRISDISVRTKGFDGFCLSLDGLSAELERGQVSADSTSILARIHMETPLKDNVSFANNGPRAAVGSELTLTFDSKHGINVDGTITIRNFNVSAGSRKQIGVSGESPGVDLDVHLGASFGFDRSFSVDILDVFSSGSKVLDAHGSLSPGPGGYAVEAWSNEIRLAHPALARLLGLEKLAGSASILDSHLLLPLTEHEPGQASAILNTVDLSLDLGSTGIRKLNARLDLDAKGDFKGSGLLSINGPVDFGEFIIGMTDSKGAKSNLDLVGKFKNTEKGLVIITNGSQINTAVEKILFPAGQAKSLHMVLSSDAQCLVSGVKSLSCEKADFKAEACCASFIMPGVMLRGTKAKVEIQLGGVRAGSVGGRTPPLSLLNSVTADANLKIRASKFASVILGPMRASLKVDGGQLGNRGFARPARMSVLFGADEVSYKPDPPPRLLSRRRSTKVGARPGRPRPGSTSQLFDLRRDLAVGKIQAGGFGHKRMADAPKPRVFLSGLNVNLRTKIRSLRAKSFPFTVKSSASSLKIGRGLALQPWSISGPMFLDAGGVLNPSDTRVSVDSVALGVGKLVELTASGVFDFGDGQIDGKFTTGTHDLKNIRASLPDDIRKYVPDVWGKVKIRGSMRGRLTKPTNYKHLPFSVDLSILHEDLGLSLKSLGMELGDIRGPIRIKAGPAYANEITTSIKVHAGRIRLGRVKLQASGVGLNLAGILTGETLSADGSLTFEKLALEDIWPKPMLDVRVDFSSRILGFKDLRLTEVKLMAPGAGLTLSGQGKVLGTQGSKEWTDLRMALSTRARFDSATFQDFPGGVKAKGRAEVLLKIDTQEPGVLYAKGSVEMDGLDLRSHYFSIRDARGSVPVSQRVRLIPSFSLLGGSSTSTRALSSAYDKALMPLKGSSRSFSVKSLGLGKLEFVSLSGNLSLNSAIAELNDLRFGFLSGDVIARTSIVLAPAQDMALFVDAQMSGLELNDLGSLNIEGASDVSGNLRLALDWNHRDLSSAFHLTHIGRSTLRALLGAIDPHQSNGGLQEFREFIQKYDVVPKEARLDIRHGLVSMIVHLDMGAFATVAAGFVHGYRAGTFYMPPVPVGNVLSKYLEF